MESLERRNLLAGDVLHNFLEPSDVNDDHAVTAVDALAIINRLNRESSGSVGEGEQFGKEGYWDVNDDGHSSAADALMVINQLNLDAAPTGSLVAHIDGYQGERVQLELEDSDSRLAVKLQNAVPNAVYDVTVDSTVVGQVHTEESGRGVLEMNDSYFASLGAGSEISVSGIGSTSFVSSANRVNDLDNGSTDTSNDDSGSLIEGDNLTDDLGVVGTTTNTESNNDVNGSSENASNDLDSGNENHGAIADGDSDADDSTAPIANPPVSSGVSSSIVDVNHSSDTSVNDLDNGTDDNGSIADGDNDTDDLPVTLPSVTTTPVVTPSVGTTVNRDNDDGDHGVNHSEVNEHGVKGHDDSEHGIKGHDDHDD